MIIFKKFKKGWDDSSVEEKLERLRLGCITLLLGWVATTLWMVVLILRI